MAQLRQVKASAGSGKTFELTRCFLQHIAQCGAPAQSAARPACALLPGSVHSWGDILAITFTNAAAAEMRARVIKQLKSAALGQPMPGLPLPPDESRHWVDVLMRDMSTLNIRTIDSLLHLIVRAAALELDLPPDFQPVFATEEALTPYLDLLLERAWQGDAALRSLLRRACRAMVHREHSTGFLAGEKLLYQLRGLLDHVLLGHLDNLSPTEALQQRLRLLEQEAAGAAQDFLALAQAQGLQWNKLALGVVTAVVNGTAKPSAFMRKDRASDLFLKGSAVSEDTERAFHAFAAASLRMLEDAPPLREALGLEPILMIARTLVEAFLRNQQQEGSLPGLLIPRLAREVLESDHGVPDALCRLGTRLTHFLVDEFQDTSREQWAALRNLVEEALSRGGSLTWVGDVKQSIYGWRGGEPELFDGVFEDTGLTRLAPDGQRHILPNNWRSRREIVEHNNRIFGPLEQTDMARCVMESLLPENTPPLFRHEAAEGLARAFADTKQNCPEQTPDGGLVHMERIHSVNAEALGEDVLDRLCLLLQEDIAPVRSWSDVLILVRSNSKATLVADRLIQESIPVITENSLLLAGHPLVAQTVALLSFLDNPEDDIAFLAVITGGIFHDHPEARELAQEDLHNWCAASGRGPLFLRFRQRWPRIWQRFLAPFYSQSGLMTPYDMTLEWFARLDVEPRFPEAGTFLRRFMEVLHSAEEKGLATLPTFLEHWRAKSNEEKAPMPEHMDAVRVMTIHKSKGLEASVVIVPWTDLRARIGRTPVVVERAGLRMAVGNKKNLGQPYYAELARQCRENMHMLYVAFTRARDALYVFRTSTVGGRGSTSDALDLLCSYAGHNAPYALGSAQPARHDQREPAPEALPFVSAPAGATAFDDSWRPMHWLPRLKIFRNPLKGFSFKAEDRGSLLHFCLEHLRVTGNAGHDARAALDFGIQHFPLPVPQDSALRESIAAALEWFAAQPEAARWLEFGWPEHSLMEADGTLLRMDLLTPEPWGLLVVDYKSGQPEAGHTAQVKKYLACLEEGGGCAPGTARGLLVYLDLRQFQVVDRTSASPLGERYADLLYREADA